MFDIKTDIQGLKELQDHIELVNKMLLMKSDSDFQDFIKNKVLEVANKVTEERLIGGTTDDEYIAEYKSRHKIRDEEDGFVLYNDTIIPPSMLPVSEKTAENYPDGFSIALAFEYGVGIVGENSPKVNAWEYNVNKWNFAWYYTKYGETFSTYGYEGFEIYRHIAEEVKSQLNDWVEEYFRKEVK